MKKRKKSPVDKEYRGEDMRLHRIISRAGLASRREAEKLIEEGRVSLNGKIVLEQGLKANPAQDEVSVDGQPVHFPSYKYYIFNKPEGLRTTKPAKPQEIASTIWSLLPNDASLNCAGRLDKQSEGALLITNDGELINMMSHPKFALDKTYQLHVRGSFEKESVIQLENGVWLSDGKMRIDKVKVKKRKKEFTIVEVKIKNKPTEHLREIFKKLGHPISRITRTMVGPLSIEDVERGDHRRLKNYEVMLLKDFIMQKTTKKKNKPKDRPPKPKVREIDPNINKPDKSKTNDDESANSEDVEFIG